MNRSPTLSARIKVSMYLAFIGGILAPALETIRRWRQIPDPRYFINWFDDYLVGGFLIWAAWRTSKLYKGGTRWLMAAWGFASGIAFSSFVFQVQHLNNPDPAPVDPVVVVIVKGGMLAVCLAGMILSYSKSEVP